VPDRLENENHVLEGGFKGTAQRGQRNEVNDEPDPDDSSDFVVTVAIRPVD
jgi:hypothetical protein